MRHNSRYVKYIASVEWQEKREEVFKQRGERCEVCHTQFNIQVHHQTYKRFGDEDLNDLVVLCFTHHEQVHALHKQYKGRISLQGATQSIITGKPIRISNTQAKRMKRTKKPKRSKQISNWETQRQRETKFTPKHLRANYQGYSTTSWIPNK